MNKMAERVLELSSDEAVEFLGNYDDYIEKKQELAEIEAERLVQAGTKPSASAAVEKPAAAGSYEADKMSKREERSRQRRLEQLEQQIADLEAEITALEERLAEPEIFNDFVKVQETNAALETKREQLAGLYEEWEGLAG